MKQASRLAKEIAIRLSGHVSLHGVDYPGLESSPSYRTATRLLIGGYGNMVTIHLKENGEQNVSVAQRFIERIAPVVPFCPSLGDARTTLSHPMSTSHRSYTADELARIGVRPGTIRFSCGLEEPDEIISALEKALGESDTKG
jgi:cystathionine beta-lyase/cystathionine gamma-synthase